MQSASDISDLTDQLLRLKTNNPQQHTLLQQYYQSLSNLLMDCDLSYPSAKQLYKRLENPSFESQGLGQMLTELAKLEVISIYADRHNRNLYDLAFSGTYETSVTAFRYAVFQLVSAATCTGFQTAVDATNVDLDQWPAQAQLTVAFGIVIGGAVGSTVGGIKLIRALTILKGIRYRVSEVFYPTTAVRRLKINGRSLNEEEAQLEFKEVAITAVLWGVFLDIGTFGLLLMLPAGEYTLENIIFEVTSAQGNVDLSAGITGPELLPTAGKIMFLFNMWIGRFEIIPLLVTLRVVFEQGGLYQ